MSTEPTEAVPSVISTPLLVVSIVFPILSLAAIALRFKARRIATENLLADDWWIIISWLLALGLSVILWAFSSIIGLNWMKIDPALGTIKFDQCISLSGGMLQASISAVKVSILLFYKRIFQTRKFKIAVWIAIVAVALWDLSYFILVRLNIDGKIHLTKRNAALSQAASSIGLDILVLTFPLPMIYGLRISKTRKVQLAFIFWLGAFCCIAATVRLVLLERTHYEVGASQAYTVIYSQWKVLVFAIIEPNCSVIAACLPCYGPLLRSYKSPKSVRYSPPSATTPINARSKVASYDLSPRMADFESDACSVEKAGEEWDSKPEDSIAVQTHEVHNEERE